MKFLSYWTPTVKSEV